MNEIVASAIAVPKKAGDVSFYEVTVVYRNERYEEVQSRTFGLVNVIKFDDTKLDRTLGGLVPVAITFQEAIGRIEAHVFHQLLRGGRTDEFDTRESNLQPVIDLKSAFERNKIQLVDFAFSGQWHYLD